MRKTEGHGPEQIGRLRTQLREWGIEKNTLLLFCSDNGPADPLAKKNIASAGPFKGHKHQMYEGGLLVPACAEWPETTTYIKSWHRLPADRPALLEFLHLVRARLGVVKILRADVKRSVRLRLDVERDKS